MHTALACGYVGMWQNKSLFSDGGTARRRRRVQLMQCSGGFDYSVFPTGSLSSHLPSHRKYQTANIAGSSRHF